MGKIEARLKRKKRIRGKIFGTKSRPRVSIFRSNKYIYAQFVNDEEAKTLLSLSSKNVRADSKMSKVQVATVVGEELAKKAKTKKIKRIVFDRGGYRYHGRVKALAESLRKGGMEF